VQLSPKYNTALYFFGAKAAHKMLRKLTKGGLLKCDVTFFPNFESYFALWLAFLVGKSRN